MHLTLIGGGWGLPAQVQCLQPFVDAATARATGATPRIAFVWVDERDGTKWSERWIDLVAKVGVIDPMDVDVLIGSSLDPARLDGVDGLFVCGGLTPAYADALAPVAEQLRALVVEQEVPYAGSSAGAAVAARRAVVGGYLDGDRVVCPEDSAEDLEQVTVVAGLGLIEQMVDVHTSAWGTLPRLSTALLQNTDVDSGLGLDEDTAWVVSAGSTQVLGRNAVHELVRDGDTVRWRALRATEK